MESNKEYINKANLQYLSKFQDSYVNKLLSTLESDIPLDPIHIKHSLLHSTSDNPKSSKVNIFFMI